MSWHVKPVLYELEALGLVVGQAGLKEHRIHSELSVEQRHIAIHLYKEIDALVTLMKVGVIMRQGLRTARATEGPPRRHLRKGTCIHFPSGHGN